MAFSRQDPSGRLAQWFRALVLTAIAGFVTATAIKALTTPWRTGDFPEDLAIKVELMPLLFPIHMIAGGLALLLVPLAMALNRTPRWHRPIARIAAADVVVAGVTAFPVALIAPVTPISAAGFATQGAVWLTLLALGIRHIRAGRVAQHRACMILMAATMAGAVIFRILLALWSLSGSPRQFDAVYAADAWIAWMAPLAITAMVLKASGTIRANR